jgi:hypothetical protein
LGHEEGGIERSIKELNHEEGGIEGWKACKVEMIFEEVRAKAKVARALAMHTYSPTCPKTKFSLVVAYGGEVEEEYEERMHTKRHS